MNCIKRKSANISLILAQSDGTSVTFIKCIDDISHKTEIILLISKASLLFVLWLWSPLPSLHYWRECLLTVGRAEGVRLSDQTLRLHHVPSEQVGMNETCWKSWTNLTKSHDSINTGRRHEDCPLRQKNTTLTSHRNIKLWPEYWPSTDGSGVW